MTPNDPLIVNVAPASVSDAEALALAFHARQTSELAQRLLGFVYGSCEDNEEPAPRAA